MADCDQCDQCGYDSFKDGTGFLGGRRRDARPVTLHWICGDCLKGIHGQEIVHTTMRYPLIRDRYVLPLLAFLWTLAIALALIVTFG